MYTPIHVYIHIFSITIIILILIVIVIIRVRQECESLDGKGGGPVPPGVQKPGPERSYSTYHIPYYTMPYY